MRQVLSGESALSQLSFSSFWPAFISAVRVVGLAEEGVVGVFLCAGDLLGADLVGAAGRALDDLTESDGAAVLASSLKTLVSTR